MNLNVTLLFLLLFFFFGNKHHTLMDHKKHFQPILWLPFLGRVQRAGYTWKNVYFQWLLWSAGNAHCACSVVMFFSCRFFNVGLKSAGKQKLLEVNIAHVRAPIFFPVDGRKNAIPLEKILYYLESTRNLFQCAYSTATAIITSRWYYYYYFFILF